MGMVGLAISMETRTTAQEKVEARVTALEIVRSRRGTFWEDEDVEHATLTKVLGWMREDKAESDRIEAEAQELAEAEAANDPNAKTKDLFNSYRRKLKQEGRMR